jgi:FixJ family two-component response regulator
MGRAPVVVIVDDHPAVCSSLKFSLELEGFVVRAHGNAAEFLNADDWAALSGRRPKDAGHEWMELIAVRT